MIGRLLTLLLAFGWSAPAFAWNSFGHIEVAAVAWERMTPKARSRVDELLKLNPSYEAWTADVASYDRARVAFLSASTWADAIKGMTAYRNDGPSNGNRPPPGPEASQNIGYADHFRHKYWHFIDIPFSPDGSPLERPAALNIQTQIAMFRAALSAAETPDDVKSYDLVWLIHLVGDAHQPLHATSRFTKALPQGDEGGNAIKIYCGEGCRETNLHAFWDDLPGPHTASLMDAADAARELPALMPELANIAGERAWLAESLRLAESTVYASPIGDGAGPYSLTKEYKARARETAELRIALAGYRLAALLNAAMGH
jgi:S1/P1 Nuclease